MRYLDSCLLMALLAGAGCGDKSVSSASQGNRTYLHERDFAGNPQRKATPDQLVIVQLEHPEETPVHDRDSGVAGIDLIPLVFTKTVEHVFTVEHKEGDKFWMNLMDEAGQEVLRANPLIPRVAQVIEAGQYTMQIYHGRGSREPYLLFVRPGESGSFLSRDCPQCDLRLADLSETGMRLANLEGVDLSGANLYITILTGAKLKGADLHGANLERAFLNEADLNGAILKGANLNTTRMRQADLTGADLTGVDLTDADLTDADLTDADLSQATWTDGLKHCASGSTGGCR